MDNKEEIKKLSDDESDSVSGGFLFNSKGISGADPDKPWEVIDGNTGETLARFNSWDEAKKDANKRNISYKEIKWEDLYDLRNMR